MTGASDPLVLELTCTLDASPERIFQALTDPAELVKWWGPSGFTTPEIEIDPRVGGSYRLGMQPPEGELFHLAGEFLEVARPSRLAYSFRWEEPDPDDQETVVMLRLDAVADQTRLSLWHGVFATEAWRALHKSGWADSLQRLAEFLESAA
ncbi:MAG: SRPBCC domain-containing protein [Actinobacteria bacterium]|nr:SRPBCC domain-containing protein [Actinomycetota bacterium]